MATSKTRIWKSFFLVLLVVCSCESRIFSRKYKHKGNVKEENEVHLNHQCDRNCVCQNMKVRLILFHYCLLILMILTSRWTCVRICLLISYSENSQNLSFNVIFNRYAWNEALNSKGFYQGNTNIKFKLSEFEISKKLSQLPGSLAESDFIICPKIRKFVDFTQTFVWG